MPINLNKLCVVLLLLGFTTLPAISMAQLADLRLPISLDADATDYDGKSSMLMFRGLRLSQGTIGVEADQGLASKLDFEDSVWQFSGNVRIDTGGGHIECDRADLRFAGHELLVATITGSPATFEMRRVGSDEVTYAEAGKLEYNFSTGVIEFSDQATIIEGGNQISSNYLVYNIAEQRINAEAGGDSGEKVKIIYTPAVDDTTNDSDSNDSQTQDSMPENKDDSAS